MKWIAYKKPKDLSEALILLEEAEGKGRVIAGGTDLILQLRPRRAEAYLELNEISHECLLEACQIASEEANPRDSLRGSAFYRKEMVKVNLIRAIEKILWGDKERRERSEISPVQLYK